MNKMRRIFLVLSLVCGLAGTSVAAGAAEIQDNQKADYSVEETIEIDAEEAVDEEENIDAEEAVDEEENIDAEETVNEEASIDAEEIVAEEGITDVEVKIDTCEEPIIYTDAEVVTTETYAAVVDGLKKINEDYYYYKDNAPVTDGLRQVKLTDGRAYYYYFGLDGTAAKDVLKNVTLSDGRSYYYYFNSKGRAVTDTFKKITLSSGESYYYYFNSKGRAVTDTLKKITLSSGESYYYYFNSKGRAVTDTIKKVTLSNGETYYYYFNSKGRAVTDTLKKITLSSGEAYYYYFDSKGRATVSELKKITHPNGNVYSYYFDAKGRAATDCLKKLAVSDTETYKFYFDSKGRAVTNALITVTNSDQSVDYYYFDSNGRAVTSKFVGIDGFFYYFKSNGKAIKNQFYTFTDPNGVARRSYFNGAGQIEAGWHYENGTWYNCMGEYACVIGTLSDGMMNAWNKIKDSASQTGYYLVVDTTRCRTYLFTGSSGNWTPSQEWLCSPGKYSSPTVKGYFTVTGRGYCFGKTGQYTCYYYTQFYGNYLFHSVLYYDGTFKLKDGRLGMNLSHGCVRMDINVAKWIYYNIPNGTRVYIY